MKTTLQNLIQFIKNSRFAPVYTITYAPADSRNPHLPIQKYSIVEHPRKLAWRSKAGNRLFTALSAKHHQFNSFRADRTLSVNFSGIKFLSPELNKLAKRTLSPA
jgi:hypothetical protein